MFAARVTDATMRYPMLLTALLLCLSVSPAVHGKISLPKTYTADRISAALGPPTESELDRLSSLLAPILVERQPGTPGHADVQRHFESHFSSLGWHLSDDAPFTMDTPRGPVSFRNLVFTFNPASPRRLVLAAHYDSKWMPGRFIGAIDSAAPCAALLRLAERFTDLVRAGAASPRRDISLQIVFFDGEEAFDKWTATDSIYGSRTLASTWSQQPSRSNTTWSEATALTDIDVLVLLDLLGAPDPVIYDTQPSGSRPFQRLARVERRLRDAALVHETSARKKSYLSLARPPWLESAAAGLGDDHVPFVERGVAVVHLIPMPFPSVWHTVKDDETAISIKVIADWERILSVFVWEYLAALK